MQKSSGQSAFSLMEMVVALAIILILAGALLGVSKYLTMQASADLTKSELEVIATALQQYYDDLGSFPFVTDINGDGVTLVGEYDQTELETDLNGDVIANGSSITLPVDDISSCALFYFMDSAPNSRQIVDALNDSLISNKDASGIDIKLDQPAGSGNYIDMPRFIDAWGTSIRYEYTAGTAFPVLTSAGPDEDFATAGDNIVCP